MPNESLNFGNNNLGNENVIKRKAERFILENKNKYEDQFYTEARRMVGILETQLNYIEGGKDVSMRTFGANKVVSSKGFEFIVKNVFFASNDFNEYTLFITVHDIENKKVVGFRNQTVHEYNSDHDFLLENGGINLSTISSDGKIDVLEKNKGIAHVIDNSLEEILQKMPFVYKEDYPDKFPDDLDVEWVVENYNLKVLNEVKKVFSDGAKNNLFTEGELAELKNIIDKKE